MRRATFTFLALAAVAAAGALPGLTAVAPACAAEPALPPGLGDGKPDEPGLPPGLGGQQKPAGEPALPDGLGGATKEEPALPPGLGIEPTPPQGTQEKKPLALPFDLTGFWELRGGLRLRSDPYEKDASLGETRLQLKADKAFEGLTLRLTADLLYDMVLNEHRVFLEEGRGMFDLREAWVALRPTSFMDLKVGRQVLTWGTGDLVFINDLFPKDWNAFFIGRDLEYLKAPSDAIKVSLFSDLANLDVVYTPRFDPDRYIDGRRLSYYNPMLGRQAGRDAVIDPEDRGAAFDDDEIALRAYRRLGPYEVALYGYHGFWKQPVGFDPVRGRATFPELAAYGASVRGPVGKGIANAEVGYYDSMDDRPGDDPLVPNSQVRALVGYEQELARDLTGGVQYYVEHMTDYGAYTDTLPAGMPRADRCRHLLTFRLTRLLLSQNLSLSLFTYYSPSDSDCHMRPHVKYKVDDHWSVEAGANVFFGNADHTFFGQFDRDSNLYVGTRYSF